MANFEKFQIGTKIQAYDKDGYYVMEATGIIEKHLGGGHVIIRANDGKFYSTVGIRKRRVFKIEQL